MFTLNEDLFDELPDAVPEEPIEISTEPESLEEPTVQEQNNAVATMLIDAINGEWETIDLYNNIIINLDGTRDADIIAVIQDIVDEENIHVGQLQRALAMVSPQTDKIADGEKEAEKQLAEPGASEASEEPALESFTLDEDAPSESFELDEESDDVVKNPDLLTRIYSELGSYHGYGEVKTEIKKDSEGNRPRRYEADKLGINPITNTISVTMPTRDELKFAEEVAKHFNVPYKYVTGDGKFQLQIKVPEEGIDDVDKVPTLSPKQIAQDCALLGQKAFKANLPLDASSELEDYVKKNHLIGSKKKLAQDSFKNGYVRANIFANRKK